MANQDSPAHPLPAHPLIVMGGSMGAIHALIQLLKHLPDEFPATILVVMHTQARQSLALAQTLQPWSEIPAYEAIDGASIKPRHLYTAVPDRHLLLSPEGMRVVMGPKEHGFRPAVDPLFRTAAQHYGKQVIGIILSGGLWDGTAGLAEVKAHGGVTIVQDPQQALVPSMPQSAINYGVADHILPIAGIAQLLVTLIQQQAHESKDAL